MMLTRKFKAFFDSFVGRVQSVSLAQHEQALRSAFAHIAPTVDAATFLPFVAHHFAISPFIPPDGRDVIYVKINHGFWEELYWLFGGEYDPERMRVQDAAQYRERYVRSGFLVPLRDSIDRVVVDEGDGFGFDGISFGISLSGGGRDHATVLSRLSSIPDNRVLIGAAIGAASYFQALRGVRRVKFCEGSFPKDGIRTGELRSCLHNFAARSARLIFVVPPHLRGVRLDGVDRPQESIIISGTHVHESWESSLFAAVGQILDALEAADAVMVVTQSSVFAVVLGLFLKEAKDALLSANKRLYFFDLGQALDVANPDGGGHWLKNNPVGGDLSLFRLGEG